VVYSFGPLQPATSYLQVGGEQTLQFKAGTEHAGKRAILNVRGANIVRVVESVRANGWAVFRYIGMSEGIDEITACLDADDDGFCTPADPAPAGALVSWFDGIISGGGTIAAGPDELMGEGDPGRAREPLFSLGGKFHPLSERPGVFTVIDHRNGQSYQFSEFTQVAYTSDGRTISMRAYAISGDGLGMWRKIVITDGDGEGSDRIYISGLIVVATPLSSGNLRIDTGILP
jgi:hypothetical protein